MSCEKSSAQALRERGLRLTPQRRLILAALRHAGGHRSANELLEEVRRVYPDVDASTVYRTLTLLVLLLAPMIAVETRRLRSPHPQRQRGYERNRSSRTLSPPWTSRPSGCSA